MRINTFSIWKYVGFDFKLFILKIVVIYLNLHFFLKKNPKTNCNRMQFFELFEINFIFIV